LFSIKKCKQEECVCGSPRTTPDVWPTPPFTFSSSTEGSFQVFLN
jgi:hypothetical protein